MKEKRLKEWKMSSIKVENYAFVRDWMFGNLGCPYSQTSTVSVLVRYVPSLMKHVTRKRPIQDPKTTHSPSVSDLYIQTTHLALRISLAAAHS